MLHRTQLLLDQVTTFQLTGQWDLALELCERAFRESWLYRNADNLTESLLRMAFLQSARGERAAAIEYFELVLTIAGLRSDERRAGRALNGLGVLHQAMGAVDAAEKFFTIAKEKAIAASDRLTEGDVEVNLGILANIRGDLHIALQHYQNATTQYNAAGDNGRLAKVLNNLGMLHIDLREYDHAADALERGLAICREIKDPATEGILLTNRTELFLSTGDLNAARRSCDAAFEIASRLGDSVLKSDVLKSYGIIYREDEKPHLAESHLQQAIALAAATENPLGEAEATRELALVFRSQDRNKEALQALNRSHALFTALQAKQEQADVNERLERLESDFLSLVARWGDSIEAKDRYTSGHCERVADYACTLARAAGMSDLDLKWFRMGAFLHDVGKTEVPEEILNKPGRLTDEERLIIERHTVVGDEMLASIAFPWDIRPMVRSHHERWDGRGYPDRLTGEDIPYTARILHIADVFDALTTTRSYRQPLTSASAFELMESDAGSFDPQLFELFRELLPNMVPPTPAVVAE
jgi:putative nucleotidyltransferase with HDIG domain